MESFLWSTPHQVIFLGLFASVSRFVATHSSKCPAHCEQGMLEGDQVHECILKSPITGVGMVTSMLISGSFGSGVLS